MRTTPPKKLLVAAAIAAAGMAYAAEPAAAWFWLFNPNQTVYDSGPRPDPFASVPTIRRDRVRASAFSPLRPWRMPGSTQWLNSMQTDPQNGQKYRLQGQVWRDFLGRPRGDITRTYTDAFGNQYVDREVFNRRRGNGGRSMPGVAVP